MTQVAESDTITSFSYDGDGGRVRKTRDDGRGTKDKTTYVGSLFEIITEGTEKSPEALKEVKHIFAGANRVCSVSSEPGTPNPVPRYSYYHPDHLGSTSVITDANGQQVAHYEYTPYKNKGEK